MTKHQYTNLAVLAPLASRVIDLLCRARMCLCCSSKVEVARVNILSEYFKSDTPLNHLVIEGVSYLMRHIVRYRHMYPQYDPGASISAKKPSRYIWIYTNKIYHFKSAQLSIKNQLVDANIPLPEQV